jgi:hypothetical protein
MTSIEDFFKEQGLDNYTIDRDENTLQTEVFVDYPNIEQLRYEYDLWCKRNRILPYPDLQQMSDIEAVSKARKQNKQNKQKKGLI